VSERPSLRVPQVREAAVAGQYAIVGGCSAWLISRLLSGYPGGLEQMLVRNGIPEDRRDDVLRAVGALAHVGAEWRVAQGSGSGTELAPESQVERAIRRTRRTKPAGLRRLLTLLREIHGSFC
jgi:hypothetical protein